MSDRGQLAWLRRRFDLSWIMDKLALIWYMWWILLLFGERSCGAYIASGEGVHYTHLLADFRASFYINHRTFSFEMRSECKQTRPTYIGNWHSARTSSSRYLSALKENRGQKGLLYFLSLSKYHNLRLHFNG